MNYGDDDQPERNVTSMRLTYEQLRQTLRRFKYFQNWTEEQIRECSILAQVVQYAPQQTIPLELPLPFAHLILSGQCMILQCLQLVRETGSPRARFQLASLDHGELTPAASRQGTTSPAAQLDQIQHWHETFNARITTSSTMPDIDDTTLSYDPDSVVAFVQTPPAEQRVVHHFLDVGTLRSGAVFGLGERHQHRTIVARFRTQCLQIPRCWLFLKKQNIGNTWQRLRMYLDWAIPTRDELYNQFLRERAWLRHRQRLIREARKRPTRTLPADVPIICRIAESTICDKSRPVLVGAKANILLRNGSSSEANAPGPNAGTRWNR